MPRVGAFLLQKAQTLPSRRASKRDKDLFYIFDLADESRGLKQKTGADVEQLRARLGARKLKEAASSLRRDCGEPASPGVARVLRQIPPEHRPLREYVAETFNRLADTFDG